MSLDKLFRLGRRLLSGKKESATPTTGQQTKQITYEPKPSQASGQELAVREIRNPPVVLKQTKPLQMGDDIAPAFGSSTYDWVMRKGRGQYTADEWLEHLTSRRKERFNIFGKPATRTVLDLKKFKYDRGPFAGKEVSISREELFDSNLAIFNDRGDLTGGLLFAAQKFGMKLDANTVGTMLKLNPVNRLKTLDFGIPQGTYEKIIKNADDQYKKIQSIAKKFDMADRDNFDRADTVLYYLNALRKGDVDDLTENANSAVERLIRLRNGIKDKAPLRNEFIQINKIISEIDEGIAPLKSSRAPRYYNEDQTLKGGDNYREVVFFLDEPILGNSAPLKTSGSHFSQFVKNEVFHVRFDTRFTPDGKKVLSIHQIQADNAKRVSEALSRGKQLSGEARKNPFQKDIENRMFLSAQRKLQQDLDLAAQTGNPSKIYKAADDLQRNTKRITSGVQRGEVDYFPMVDAADYSDHALKYLLQLAAREGADYVAVLPFDMLNYKASVEGFAGNERAYGYASGKGINKKGKAIIPELMKKTARFFGSSAGPIKISRSNPKKPYKKIDEETYVYKEGHLLGPKGKEGERGFVPGKSFTRIAHTDASENPKKGYKLITEDNPNLYFDAFAIKVNNLMRGTQKTYKSKGGLVVDIFKTRRYN